MGMRMKSILYTSLPVMAFALLFGCSDKHEESTYFNNAFLEIVPRVETFESSTNKTIATLSNDDVLVAVNGYPLTKGVFTDLMLLKARELMRRKNANANLVSNQLAEFEKQYLSIFVSQRLMIDEATRLNVVSSNELERIVNDTVSEAAKRANKTIHQYVTSFPGDFKYCLYEIAAKAVISKLVQKHIPPLVETSSEFVSNVQSQVALDNIEAGKTNQAIRLQMLEWKKTIESGESSFEALAKEYSQDTDFTVGKPGSWGEYERGRMDDKNIQAVAFSLKPGQISDPIEDDDGFHLLKVVKITPATRNKDGKILMNEVRELAHIYREKTPLLIVQSDEDLYQDLKHQMQVRAIDDYVTNLRTNGANRIEYPNGKALFK